MSDPSTAFAANLRRLRRERGWTQHDLAEHSGLSVGTIGNLEGGRNGVGLNRAWVLAKTVEASLDEMCEEPAEGLMRASGADRENRRAS